VSRPSTVRGDDGRTDCKVTCKDDAFHFEKFYLFTYLSFKYIYHLLAFTTTKKNCSIASTSPYISTLNQTTTKGQTLHEKFGQQSDSSSRRNMDVLPDSKPKKIRSIQIASVCVCGCAQQPSATGRYLYTTYNLLVTDPSRRR